MMAVDEYRSNLNLEAPHERSNKQRETERSKMARGQNIKKRCQTSRSSGDRIACSPAEAAVGSAPDHDHTPSFRFGGDWWAKCKKVAAVTVQCHYAWHSWHGGRGGERSREGVRSFSAY